MVLIDIQKKLHCAEGVVTLETGFELETGTITALCGPSGCGKTTLLRMIAGITEPDKGSIKVEDGIWYDSSAGINIIPQERKVGLVFQDYPLFPNMTVLGNLLYAEDDLKWAKELLGMVGMEGLQTKYPRKISGGQRQRVSFAQALMRRPRLLLLDEPFSALDKKMKDQVCSVLITLWKQIKFTVIFSTHDETEASRFCTNMLFIDEGEINKQSILNR